MNGQVPQIGDGGKLAGYVIDSHVLTQPDATDTRAAARVVANHPVPTCLARFQLSCLGSPLPSRHSTFNEIAQPSVRQDIRTQHAWTTTYQALAACRPADNTMLRRRLLRLSARLYWHPYLASRPAARPALRAAAAGDTGGGRTKAQPSSFGRRG